MGHRVGVSSILVVLFLGFILFTLPFAILLFTIILFFTVWVIPVSSFLDSDSYFFFSLQFFVHISAF